MKPLYTEKEFESAKSRQLLPLVCLQCNQTFYKPKHVIQKATRGMKAFPSNFCSRDCSSKNKTKKVECACDHCGKIFMKNKSQIKKTKSNFCCQSCAGKYGTSHKTTGTRSSRLEKWLAVKLSEKFPTLEFHFNRKDAINSELDIYIPTLKLAFELNGPFHYEPIFGQEKLETIKNNDCRKFQACLEKGIELCIIDTSKQKYFKENTCLPFLRIVEDIILLKISTIHKDAWPWT